MKTIHPDSIGVLQASHVAVARDTQGPRFAALFIPTEPRRGGTEALGAIARTDPCLRDRRGWRKRRGTCLVFMAPRPLGQTGTFETRKAKQPDWMRREPARSVLCGQATARPKTQTGSLEMIWHLKIAGDGRR